MEVSVQCSEIAVGERDVEPLHPRPVLKLPSAIAVSTAMVIRLYSAAKYPRRLDVLMDQSMIDPIASITPSSVVTVGMGGSGGGFLGTPTVLRGKVLGVVKVDQFGVIAF